MIVIKKILSKYTILIGVVLISLYLSPFIILGENSYIRIHDTLDGRLPRLVAFAQSGHFDGIDMVNTSIMNGIIDNALGSRFNVIIWFFLLFPPFTAYILNSFLVHVIAFIGMFLLLREHFFKNETNEHIYIIFGCSLAFGLLPFMPLYGLSIAGQPLLLYAFLNIRNKQHHFLNYLIIFLFPFYSFLVASGVFIVTALGIFFIWDSFTSRKINKQFLYALFILVATQITVEYNLINQMLFEKGFISHRVTWNYFYSYSFADAVKKTADNIVHLQTQAITLHTPILLFCGLAMVVNCFQNRKLSQVNRLYGRFRNGNIRLLFVLLVIAFCISVFAGFYNWSGLNGVKDSLPLLKSFQADRFYFLHPVLWYLILGVSLCSICRMKHGNILACGLVLFQIGYIFINSNRQNNFFIENVQLATRMIENKSDDHRISYGEFFSSSLFEDIHEYIGRPKKEYGVVSVGIYPSIATYSGFFCLDGYVNNYSLEYKHLFRKIIEEELDKSKRWREYFDNWGNRCYVFTSELDHSWFENTKSEERKIYHLELNTGVLKEMGGEYIFSAVEIVNDEESGLRLAEVFEREDSPWRIYLYVIL